MSTTLKSLYPNLQKFKKDFYDFYSFNSFYLKIVTILSLIFRDGKNYCFCEKYHARINYMVCPMCEIPMYFWNCKNDLKKNRMDPIFMDRYRDKLFTFLWECFVINEPSLACFFWTFPIF